MADLTFRNLIRLCHNTVHTSGDSRTIVLPHGSLHGANVTPVLYPRRRDRHIG
jgi:hypothetical protein